MPSLKALLIALPLALFPAAVAAQGIPPDPEPLRRETARPIEPPRPFLFRFGLGYTRSAYDHLNDGGNLMAAFVWPAASVARLRVEAFTSIARWKYFGWDPGEAQILDNLHWVDGDYERLSGAGVFLELSHRAGIVRPYLFTGLSYYQATWKDTDNTDYGAAAGAGIDFDLASWRFFAEGSFRLFGLTGRITNDPQGVLPVTVGIRF